DYRGEQTMNVIAHAAFVGVDHPGRAFLALAIYYRYAGLKEECAASQRLKELLTPRMLEQARILAGVFRVAYIISAAMPDVLPKIDFHYGDKRLILNVPPSWQSLASERVMTRVKQLGKLLGRDQKLGVSFDDPFRLEVR
ncbi:MAG: exopolyphosphatase, partial [Beijerinckiaceae bacterium]